MKSLLLFFIATAFCSFLPTPRLELPTPQNMLDFIAGNLVSLKVPDTIPDIHTCAQNIKTFKNNTLQAISLIKQGYYYSGLILLEQTINGTWVTCSAVPPEFNATISNFLRIVRDPYFFQLLRGRVKDNIDVLFDFYSDSVDKLNNKQFFEAGVSFGKIPHLLLSGPNDTALHFTNLIVLEDNGTHPVVDFLKGYLESVQVWNSVPQAQECLQDLLDVKETVSKVIELFKEGKLVEAIELLNQTVTNDFATCKSSLDDATTLFHEFLQNVERPGFLSLAIARLTNNFLDVLQDDVNGIKDLSVKDFYNAGVELGKVAHLILSGSE